MKTLGGRVLVLIAGFSLLLATMIGGVGQMTYREYREEMVSARAQGFAERILDTFPDLWQTFNTDPWRLNERLSEFVLFEPNTGLYLLDRDGRVLATAGEARSFWQTYRVDLAQLLDAMHDEPTDPVFGDDPDSIEARALDIRTTARQRPRNFKSREELEEGSTIDG
jgi:hypothetical protein